MTVPLGPLNVLVGPNAAGKTNLLKVVQFLGDSVRDDLQPALAVIGGFDRVLFRGRRRSLPGTAANQIEIGIKANVTTYASRNAPDEYTLRFWKSSYRSGAWLVRTEDFRFKRTQGRGRRITISGVEVDFIETDSGGETVQQRLPLREDSLALSTLPRLAPREGGLEVTKVAELFSTFRVFDVDVRRAQLPSEQPTSSYLEKDASNLASFLAYLHKAAPRSFAELQKDACAIVPELKQITLRPIGGPREGVAIELEERGLKSPTALAEASFGTIRALALLAMLHDPNPPQLTCVEELDHGLHPYSFDRIADRLREASSRTQFIIATHSPALVNRLRATELIVCERDVRTGASRVPAIDAATVQEIERRANGKLRLGEIWFTGTLGGVPE